MTKQFKLLISKGNKLIISYTSGKSLHSYMIRHYRGLIHSQAIQCFWTTLDKSCGCKESLKMSVTRAADCRVITYIGSYTNKH